MNALNARRLAASVALFATIAVALSQIPSNSLLMFGLFASGFVHGALIWTLRPRASQARSDRGTAEEPGP